MVHVYSNSTNVLTVGKSVNQGINLELLEPPYHEKESVVSVAFK